jgi:hypothetical protein
MQTQEYWQMRMQLHIMQKVGVHDPDPILGKMQAIYLETTAAGGVTWEEVEEAQLKQDGSGGSGGGQPRRKLKISIPKWCGKWVVSMDEYKDGVVGAKSKNLAGARLPLSWDLSPTCCSVNLPCRHFSRLPSSTKCRMFCPPQAGMLRATARATEPWQVCWSMGTKLVMLVCAQACAASCRT